MSLKERGEEALMKETKTCKIKSRKVTENTIREILENQQNTNKLNDRISDDDALKVALKGSKIYLEAQGYIDD